MRDAESGFTLIELMIAVVVVSILAAIALPSFFGETGKVKASAEVQPMFNDLRIRLEQYMQEYGHYPVTTGEITPHPPGAPSTTKQPINPLPSGTWQGSGSINVRVTGNDYVYCSYTWSTGDADDDTNISSRAKDPAPNGFAFATPSTNWYYLLAKCDMDGDPAVYSWYFASSIDPTILKLNEGS